MYLSKNSLLKLIIISSAFLLVAGVFYVAAYMISKSELSPRPTVILAVVFTVIAFLSVPFGFYADGVSKPFSEGTRLVRRDLQPQAFITYYKDLTDPEKAAIIRHRYDILELLLTSYKLLDDRAGVISTLELMKTSLPAKHKSFAALRFAEDMYENGDVEGADALVAEAEKRNGGAELTASADDLKKSVRAKALNDYETEEKYYNGLLSAKGIFKADNAAALFAHYRLYDVCKKTGREREALEHLKYCAEYGGKTAIARRAKKKLA